MRHTIKNESRMNQKTNQWSGKSGIELNIISSIKFNSAPNIKSNSKLNIKSNSKLNIKLNNKLNIKLNNKLIVFIYMALFVILFSSINAHALGVAPSRKVVDYNIGTQSYDISIINNENKDMNVFIYFQGELAEYASISQNTIHIGSNEAEKKISYKLDLPAGLAPGPKKLDVMALELQEDINTEDIDKTMIFSTVLIVHQLRVNVPYPGAFAEGVLYISEANVNEMMTFTVNVLNKGTQPIQDVHGEVVIRGPTNEEIKRIQTGTINSIASGQAEKLSVSALADMNAGLYTAEFIVNYNDKQFVLRDDFMVGSQSIEIEGINVETFKLGTIAKFDVGLLNKWNQPIDTVYADMEVLTDQSVKIASFKTSPVNLMQLSRGTITGYWDTKGIDVGTYDVKVILNYEGRTLERIFRTVVGIDSIRLQDSSLSGQVISSEGDGNKLSLLYILIIVSIVFNIGLFIYFKFMRKKNQELQ